MNVLSAWFNNCYAQGKSPLDRLEIYLHGAVNVAVEVFEHPAKGELVLLGKKASISQLEPSQLLRPL